MPKIIIFAPNVGSGGGLVLLRDLIYANNAQMQLMAIVDSRGMSQIEVTKTQVRIIPADPTLFGRWRAERILQRLANRDDIVLCFHNLPPLLPNTAKLICYVHNVFVIDKNSGGEPFGWVRSRRAVERFIAATLRRRIAKYVVQTPLMRDRLTKWFGDNPPPIDVLPFVPHITPLHAHEDNNATVSWPPSLTHKQLDFFYPSDGSKHKNHLRLFTAWCELAETGHFPHLAVTLHPDHDAELLDALANAVNKSGARIENLGKLNHTEVIAQYRAANALIFPSLVESFGLPLVEASRLQLPILAPELDYVRQVCEPTQTFDPFSSRSIAMAVLRFLGEHFKPIPLTAAADFLAKIQT